MIWNNAVNVMFGSNNAEKCILNGNEFWSKANDNMMPHLNGVVNYYDSKKGLSVSSWKNQIAGESDISWTGAELQQDGSVGVYGTSNSYGSFTSLHSTVKTLYCLFKAPEIGVIRLNRHIVGSCGGSINSYRTGAWFTIATEHYGYNTQDKVQSDQWGVGIQGVEKGSSYHLVTLSRDTNGVNTLYVDGVAEGTLSNSVACGDNWGVGLIMDDYGNLGESPSSLQQIHFIALANTCHSAQQIAENSAWLLSYYQI